jgi:hypothetical protein
MSNRRDTPTAGAAQGGAVKRTELDADRRKAEEESKASPASKPGGFNNDPDDPTNPNEARERTLKKIRR